MFTFPPVFVLSVFVNLHMRHLVGMFTFPPVFVLSVFVNIYMTRYKCGRSSSGRDDRTLKI